MNLYSILTSSVLNPLIEANDFYDFWVHHEPKIHKKEYCFLTDLLRVIGNKTPGSQLASELKNELNDYADRLIKLLKSDNFVDIAQDVCLDYNADWNEYNIELRETYKVLEINQEKRACLYLDFLVELDSWVFKWVFVIIENMIEADFNSMNQLRPEYNILIDYHREQINREEQNIVTMYFVPNANGKVLIEFSPQNFNSKCINEFHTFQLNEVDILPSVVLVFDNILNQGDFEGRDDQHFELFWNTLRILKSSIADYLKTHFSI